MNDIKLRDYFAGQLMAGKVNDIYASRVEEEEELWVQVSSAEATLKAIEQVAEQAYIIADALVRASHKR